MFLWWLFWLVRCGKPFVAHTEMCLLKRASWRRPSLRRAQTDKCIKLCRNSFHMSAHAYIHIPALQVTHTHLSTLLRLSYVGFWMLNQASLGQPASLERPFFYVDMLVHQLWHQTSNNPGPAWTFGFFKFVWFLSCSFKSVCIVLQKLSMVWLY